MCFCVSVHKQVSGTTSLNLTKYHVHVTYGHGSVLYDTLCTGTLVFMNDVTTFIDRLYSLCMVLVVFLVTTTAGDKSIIIIIVIIIIIIIIISLQCFDAVGWAAGRASGL